MDKLTTERRSANMRAIRSKHMKPELVVRRTVYGLGYRYRLHKKHLPGKPDLVFAGKRKAIFVHGCFWHQHQECREGRIPKTNLDYWKPKLARNVVRDAENERSLREAGWSVLTLWECETKAADQLAEKLEIFLSQ